MGILFSASGTFGEAKNELYNKALKAYYKLSKIFGELTPSVKTSIHLFHHTVKPILLYGSEIWGQFNCHQKILSENTTESILHKLYPKLKCDLLHLRFMKHTLGVGKCCSDVAVYGELGEMPLYTDILLYMCNYWHRLHSVDENSLLYNAFKSDCDLYSNGKDSFNMVIEKVGQQLGLNDLFKGPIPSKTIFKKIIRKKIQEMYIITWKNKLFDDKRNNPSEGNKLRTYRIFKNDFKREIYLSQITCRDERKRLCQLRTSAHKLHLETGRHLKIPECDRVCNMCKCGQIENEIHFVIKCSAYSDAREIFFNEVIAYNNNFKGLSDDNKFIWLMLNEDYILNRKLAKFVNLISNIRYNDNNSFD